VWVEVVCDSSLVLHVSMMSMIFICSVGCVWCVVSQVRSLLLDTRHCSVAAVSLHCRICLVVSLGSEQRGQLL
jgi:hypothetical protein